MATAAVPGLEVSGARPHSRGSYGQFDSALLRSTDGRTLLIRVPTSSGAELEQSADLVALRALSAGIRARLPFAVPTFVGQAPVSGTRAVVYDYVPGAVRDADELTAEPVLAAEVGASIAAIHGLPSAFLAESGLPGTPRPRAGRRSSSSSAGPPTPAACRPRCCAGGSRPRTTPSSGSSRRP
ncbi:protein kinase family protein [Agromyces mangrovi Wang et al. 2018]|uniref:hypothetical protein n=1 Tax=Agromyces mangrovi TaxID=1858653 RepID=UPI0025740506|nr:hypothetical protein [Agromyces mangrovi]